MTYCLCGHPRTSHPRGTLCGHTFTTGTPCRCVLFRRALTLTVAPVSDVPQRCPCGHPAAGHGPMCALRACGCGSYRVAS